MLAANIAFGLHYLHNLCGAHAPIIHGGLKPQNVLINRQPLQVKLCDFGLSRTSSLALTRTRCLPDSPEGGNQLWLAPELCRAITSGQKLRKTTASDVYAFGVVMYETITGLQPFYNIAAKYLFLQVTWGLQPQFEDWHFPEEHKEAAEMLMSLMKKCWSLDPGDRPDINEVCQQLLQIMDRQLK